MRLVSKQIERMIERERRAGEVPVKVLIGPLVDEAIREELGFGPGVRSTLWALDIPVEVVNASSWRPDGIEVLVANGKGGSWGGRGFAEVLETTEEEAAELDRRSDEEAQIYDRAELRALLSSIAQGDLRADLVPIVDRLRRRYDPPNPPNPPRPSPAIWSGQKKGILSSLYAIDKAVETILEHTTQLRTDLSRISTIPIASGPFTPSKLHFVPIEPGRLGAVEPVDDEIREWQLIAVTNQGALWHLADVAFRSRCGRTFRHEDFRRRHYWHGLPTVVDRNPVCRECLELARTPPPVKHDGASFETGENRSDVARRILDQLRQAGDIESS